MTKPSSENLDNDRTFKRKVRKAIEGDKDIKVWEALQNFWNSPARPRDKADATHSIKQLLYNELKDKLPKEIHPSYFERPKAESFTGTDATLRETLQSTLDASYNTGFNAGVEEVHKVIKDVLGGKS